MKKFRSPEMKAAYINGGYRERYAMDNGIKQIVYINGDRCYKFIYADSVTYQDANGAIYNTIRKSWIN